ncbi:MAG: glycosyltransferase [Bdellovibrionales bacterium]
MVLDRKFSIITATFNSGRTLEKCLSAIRAQTYPRELVEILVVDGGSTDNTREIAKRFGCRIVENPRVEPMTAKLIGLKEATGEFLMHVDSDEVLESPRALEKRLAAFVENPGVAMVFATGYANPPGAPFAARYINEFGDPFSMFYYRLSKDYRRFINSMRRLHEVKKETADYIVFSLNHGPQPILTNEACGNCIDLKFFREHFSELFDKAWGPTLFFYHMQKVTKVFAITRDDAIFHYSADQWRTFLLKIKWRVRNNIFFQSDMGASGFGGRVEFDGVGVRLKKYLYIPYAFLLVPALLDAIYLAWTRRDGYYLLHFPLTIYTASWIVGMMILKIFGYRPPLTSYGGQRAVPIDINAK